MATAAMRHRPRTGASSPCKQAVACEQIVLVREVQSLFGNSVAFDQMSVVGATSAGVCLSALSVADMSCNGR
jgi:hypothetical protein